MDDIEIVRKLIYYIDKINNYCSELDYNYFIKGTSIKGLIN